MARVTQKNRGLHKKVARFTQKSGEGYPKLNQYCVTRGSTSWNLLSDDKNVRLGGVGILLGGGGQANFHKNIFIKFFTNRGGGGKSRHWAPQS